jgi:cell division protein FtsZ
MGVVAAGMGGGTGTGAAPVIARAARERGILTVAVVTKPFHFEGQRRMEIAEAGVQELRKHVDTLIVIPNQNLFRIANDRTTFGEAFQMADQVLYSGVRGVTDLMVMPGLINLDFADVRTVMAEMGTAMMGNGEATGPNRALDAAHAAITNPLLDIVSMKGARGVLINITGGLDMTLYEVDAAANEIRAEVDPQANIILGSTFDDQMEGFMRVSVVATGIDDDAVLAQHTVVPNARRAADGYGGPIAPRRNIMDQAMLSGAIDPLGGPAEEGYADDPFVAERPSFGPAGQEEEEAPARKGGFGWFSKRKDEPEPKIEPREQRRLPEPDAALDEELEIPAFLRRQMTQR